MLWKKSKTAQQWKILNPLRCIVSMKVIFLLCVCYIIVLKMPEIKNGILFPARFKQPLWSASRNLTTKGKPLLIHFIVKKYINEAGGVRWGLEGLTDCTLFMQNAKPTLQKDQFLIQLWLCKFNIGSYIFLFIFRREFF